MDTGRLEAFSDGVLAIIITIMVLELKVPQSADIASLIPFATGWMGENHSAPAPTALYGVPLLMAAIAYWLLQRAIVAKQGKASLLAFAVGRDLKGNLSPILYVVAIPAAFVQQWIAGTIYVFVALMWLIPDRRIERALARYEGRREGRS